MSRHPPFQYAAVPANRPWLSHYDVGVPPAIKYSSQTVQDLLAASARRFPDRTCTLMGNQVWSYAEVETGALALARALVSLGVKKGDRIGILMPNIPQFVLGFYGIVTAGAVVVALNPLGTSSEHFHQLHDSGIGILLVSSDQYPKIAGGSDGGDLFRAIVATPNDRPSPQSGTASAESKTLRPSLNLRKRDLWLADVLASPGTGSGTMPVVDAHDTALFQYSGGTTGPSKAAVATHAGVVANTIQFRHWLVGLQEGCEVVLMAIPLNHAYGMIAGMSLGIAIGASLALVPNPRDIDALLDAVRAHRPTLFPGVPGLYNVMANHPDVSAGRVDLASIRVCISGSTALMRETKQRFESLSGGRICEGYGLSEAPVVTHCNPLLGPNKIGSIGMPMPDVDCRIVEDDANRGQRDVAPGSAGELILRGPQLMSGYHNNPAETAIALRRLDDGHAWLFTGDIARMDEDGYFYIVDRKKDVIKPGGFQVWPREVEEVLATHPSVLEVGVAGIQEPTRGEIVKAWIVLRPEHSATAEELRSWCEERLPHYKIPAEIEFRLELPKSNVGKVLRRELVREHREAAHADPPPAV